MSRKITRNTNKRNKPTLEDRIKQALAKKPTASYLNSKGLTADKIDKLFHNQPPADVRRVLNQKGARRYKNIPTKKLKRRPPPEIYLSQATELAMPSWFTGDVKRQIDVSIVVPMYKSEEVIKEQIASWDLKDDGLAKEIIYVNDACPNDSYKEILVSWESRQKQLKGPVGKIILHDKNGGFGQACNTGAKFASGKYIIFLNADCTVTENWIRPMVELIESNIEIGMVGNMQLKKGGQIDSAGSAWDWLSGSFLHIGRNIYDGKKIHTPMKLKEAPRDLLVPGEREMVTGCCFLIPRDLFVTLDGFDHEYRVGYWEDSDLNMRVRSLGYKIFFQPDSKIYHKLGHSKAGGHGHISLNRELFKSKWVDTGRFEEFVETKGKNSHKTIKDNITGKVVGCVIACNEEEFLEVSVDSVASIVDEWVFVIGGNEYAYKSGMCHRDGHPTDNTLNIARKLATKYKATVIEPPGRLWKDKVEMRNAYVDYLKPGNWMFMLDGDEVYNTNQLWRVTELMKKHNVLIMQFWLFWNNMQTLGTGSWERYPQERVVRWAEGFGYRNGNHLHVSNANGDLVSSIYPCWRGDEKLFFHYSWVRPLEKIRQKREYYKHQSGNKNDTYVDEVFLKWRKDPHSVIGQTHPMGGGNFKPFEGVHPPGVQKLLAEGKFNF